VQITTRIFGIAEVVISGVLFGFLGYFGRQAFAKGLTAGELLSLRFLISALAIFLFFSLKRLLVKNRPLNKGLRLSRTEIIDCILLGVLGYAVFSSFFFMALGYISASLTVLLLYLYPCFVAIISHFYLNERLFRKDFAALVLSLLGLVFLVAKNIHITSTLGVMLGIGSAVFYAAYILYSRQRLQGTSSWASVFYIQLSAGLILSMIHIRDIGRVHDVLLSAWPVIMAVSIVCTLFAMSLFLSGLRKLSGTEVSILSTTEPLTGLVVAAFYLDERLSGFQYLGGFMVLGGLCLLALRKKTVR
jgi:drug/metabolite transporter (DMT)-like permease